MNKSFKRRALSIVMSVLLGLNAASALAEKNAMTLADLQALEKQGGWGELSQHLADVPPSQRDAGWEKIAVNTALGLLTSAAKSKLPGDTFSSAEALLEKFPQLAKNKEFMVKRGEVGVQSLKQCFSDNNWWPEGCYREVIRFSERDSSNDNAEFALGKLIRLQGRHANATPFFERALAKSTGANGKRCEDEDVLLAVLDSFTLPAADQFKGLTKSGQTIATKYCSSALRPILVKDFPGANSYQVANACSVMKVLAPKDPAVLDKCK
jgi:hypothetical protein